MKTLDVFCGMMYKIPDSSVFFSAGLFAANIICILLALNVLSSNFGFVTASSQHLIAIFLLLGVVLLNLPLRQAVRHLSKENPHLMQLTIGILLCLFGFLLLIISKTQLLWVCSLPVILSGLDLCLQGMDHRRNELYLLTIASFGYAVVFSAYRYHPYPLVSVSAKLTGDNPCDRGNDNNTILAWAYHQRTEHPTGVSGISDQ